MKLSISWIFTISPALIAPLSEASTIKQFALLKQSPLEKFERLEQLRALENNMKIDVVTVEDPGISIDTKKDLERIDR